MLTQQVLKKIGSSILSFAIVLSLLNPFGFSSKKAYAASGEGLALFEVKVNKPVNAVVDVPNAAIGISLPYSASYQMLNVKTNPSVTPVVFRSDETTPIPVAASGINEGDAKLDRFSPDGTSLYYLVLTDKNDSSNSRKYTITVKVEKELPASIANDMGPNDKFSPLNIKAGEHAWDVLGASKIGYGGTTGSIEGPGKASSYSGKDWFESVYDRSGDYPAAQTVPDSWLGDNMYLQTIGRTDVNALAKYRIEDSAGLDKLGTDILRFHEFLPFKAPGGVSRDDGDRGAVNSDRQRLEIKSNTSSSNIDANSRGGDIMTHHWKLMLPSETIKYQMDTAEKEIGDFIAPRRFFHIFQLKAIEGDEAGQPVTTLTIVSVDGKGYLEFRNNPDGQAADRIKPLFTIPLEQVVDRWLDMEVTILSADKGYVYGELVDVATNTQLWSGGMTAETFRRPEVLNPDTGKKERADLPALPGQQNRSKWGLYRGMYNTVNESVYADEFQAATMYLSDIYLIKRDESTYVFPDGWNPNSQPKDIVAWERPSVVSATPGTAFDSLELPAQLDVTLSTGKVEKVNVTWSPEGYHPEGTGTFRVYGAFDGTVITNTKGIKPYVDINISGIKNWAVAPGAEIKVVSQSGGTKNHFIDDRPDTAWQAHSSLARTEGYQYWAAVKLEKKIEISRIQLEWSSNSKFLKNYQVYYTNNAAAYEELKEGATLSATSSATRNPLLTEHGSSWIRIPGAGKATDLSNNETADLMLNETVDGQYVLLVADLTLDSSAGGIKSNAFTIIGQPSRPTAQLEDLRVDGTSLADFSPSQTGYSQVLSGNAITLPNVTAEAPAGIEVKVDYPDDYRVSPVTITAYDPNGTFKAAKYTIAFTSASQDTVAVSSIHLRNVHSLALGKKTHLLAEILPQDATFKTVTWESDNPAVVTVDANGRISGVSKGTAVITARIGSLSKTSMVTVKGAADLPTATGSVNLLAPSRFTAQPGVNLKVSSEHPEHPGTDALKSGGTGYWRNSSPNVYKDNYAPSSLALTLDLGAAKTVDKLYLEIPNAISNIQKNATRFEVYYSNDPYAWASAPTASDLANSYDWEGSGWKLAGGTETEGMWSYVTYNGQQWGFDTKTFLYPFTARYVMINTVLVGPRDRRTDEHLSVMGLSGLVIYGKDPVSNATALTPAKSVYSTWDQSEPISTTVSLAGGQTIMAITNGQDKELVLNTDYKVTGNTLTFEPSLLAKLPLGTNEFTIQFNSGAPSVFALDVTARGLGATSKTIKMNAIEGVSPYHVLGGAMGTDEPVEGATKRIRDAYHEYYGDRPEATLADDHIQSVWDSTLQKNVFKVMTQGRGLNNEFEDKVRDGEYAHKGVFDGEKGYVVGGAAINDRQRIEIRPSEDSTQDFTAYDGDIVSYQWLWNIPDGSQWNQPNFRHIFQLKATNAQAADTLAGGNSGGENGAYILAMSITGRDTRELVVNHNRYDGDKTLMRIPLKDIDSHWLKVELNALISDSGWLTIKITDTVTGKVYTFDSPDVYQVFPKQGAGDGVKDLWRRPERSVKVGSSNVTIETEYPAAFDQYLRPKWGIYRSSNGTTNAAYDAELQLSDITITKLASGVSPTNLALNKKVYNSGSTEGANAIQLASANANGYGNANKLTNGVLEDPIVRDVTNVTSLDQIGNYAWLGTDGARKGSFVIDLGQPMDFSQIRLFAKSTRLKGATVYVSDEFNDPASPAEWDAMNFKQVELKTAEGYTFATGNLNGGDDTVDASYAINLGRTYHSRYIKMTVENASGGNAGTDLTGPPRLTQVQVFNAPAPPQHVNIGAAGSAAVLTWDSSDRSEGYTVYNGATAIAELPADATSFALPADLSDTTKLSVRSKGTDPYSRKFMISAPAFPAIPEVIPHIVSIAPENIVTEAGIAPVMPTVVSAVYSDSSTQQLPVAWDNIDPSQYAAPGSFTVEGTVTGATYKAVANVAVTLGTITWPAQSQLSVSEVSETTAMLRWTAAQAARGVAGYKLYSVTGSTYTEFASVGDVLTYRLTGLTEDSQYTFTIQAVDKDRVSSVYGPVISFRTNEDSRDAAEPPASSGPVPVPAPSNGSNANPGIIDLAKDTLVTKETAADGSTITKVVVDAKVLEKALANPVVVIEVKGSDPTVHVELSGNAILKALDPQSRLVIQSNEVRYVLPVALFANIRKDSTVVVSIAKVTGKAGDEVNAAVNQLNAKQVIPNPIEFTITVNGSEFEDFGGLYVDRTIDLGQVTINPAHMTAVWVDSNNRLHFVPSIMEFKDGSAQMTIRSPHNSVYTVIQSEKSFGDLQGHWAKSDIELLANKWILNGMTDQHFVPEAKVTRAEFAAMLVRSLGLEETKNNAFRDVLSSDWFAGAVGSAYKAGLIDGYEDGTFQPNAIMTREQMVAMAIRAMKAGGKVIQADSSVLNGFTDRSDIGQWSKEAVSQAVKAGVIQGMSDNVFAANESATRAQAAVILKRMLQSLQFIN
ncbi:S-layer homology domain-containing protein [Paenibacillus puerhi]|uniref:S-layer homology domain-containing protein n=1 Tax=Paenibacillus puerhi TaxID=2692622 RepID=UPI00135CC7C1|nr:S-layer homology domain-containing protein [Paenibacillus puerhi]